MFLKNTRLLNYGFLYITSLFLFCSIKDKPVTSENKETSSCIVTDSSNIEDTSKQSLNDIFLFGLNLPGSECILKFESAFSAYTAKYFEYTTLLPIDSIINIIKQSYFNKNTHYNFTEPPQTNSEFNMYFSENSDSSIFVHIAFNRLPDDLHLGISIRKYSDRSYENGDSPDPLLLKYPDENGFLIDTCFFNTRFWENAHYAAIIFNLYRELISEAYYNKHSHFSKVDAENMWFRIDEDQPEGELHLRLEFRDEREPIDPPDEWITGYAMSLITGHRMHPLAEEVYVVSPCGKKFHYTFNDITIKKNCE